MWSITALTLPLSQVGDQQVHSLPRGVAVRYRQRPLQQQQLPVHPAIDPHQPIRVQRPQQAPQLLPVRERISECISFLIWYVAVLRFLWQTPRLTGWRFESVCVFLFSFLRLASQTRRRTSRLGCPSAGSYPVMSNRCAIPARGQRWEVTIWESLTGRPPTTPQTQPYVSSHRSQWVSASVLRQHTVTYLL